MKGFIAVGEHSDINSLPNLTVWTVCVDEPPGIHEAKDMATLLESSQNDMEHCLASSPDTPLDTTLSDPNNNDQESSSDAFVIDSSLYLEEGSLSAQSTPSRRPLRKWKPVLLTPQRYCLLILTRTSKSKNPVLAPSAAAGGFEP